MAILFILTCFVVEKYLSVFSLVPSLNRGLKSNKPTLNLVDYGCILNRKVLQNFKAVKLFWKLVRGTSQFNYSGRLLEEQVKTVKRLKSNI